MSPGRCVYIYMLRGVSITLNAHVTSCPPRFRKFFEELKEFFIREYSGNMPGARAGGVVCSQCINVEKRDKYRETVVFCTK